MKIKDNVLLSELTTMGIGGPARHLIEIHNLKDLEQSHIFAKQHNLPIFILGSGSNSLGTDEGYHGVIIKPELKGIEFDSESGILEAGAGETWDDVVKVACDSGFSGIEALSGIPGSAGASAVQNIGAYGQEIKETLISTTVYDFIEQDYKELNNEQMNFSYRYSLFNDIKTSGRYCIVSIKLKLSKKFTLSQPFYNSLQNYLDSHQIIDYSTSVIRDAVLSLRKSKLPDPKIEKSAGSFFKNIIVNDQLLPLIDKHKIPIWPAPGGEGKVINSGWLIEQAGLKGEKLHGYEVCQKASLILINRESQSYQDLVKARREIRDIVYKKVSIGLFQEPVLIA